MWPTLKFAPINLWNVPYMFKERTIIDKILDVILRYYITTKGHATVLYIGRIQYFALCMILSEPEEVTWFNDLKIVRVEQEDYLRVG